MSPPSSLLASSRSSSSKNDNSNSNSSCNNSNPAKKKISNPYVSSIVQTKSIHSSLSSLSKEVEDLRQATSHYESKHRQLFQELNQRQRPLQKTWLERIREARVTAGKAMQESRSLVHQKQGLERQLQEESKHLKQDFEEETNLLEQEAEQKRKYLQKAQALNVELNLLQKRQEKERLLTKLHDTSLLAGKDSEQEREILMEELLSTTPRGNDAFPEQQQQIKPEEEAPVVRAVTDLWEASRCYTQTIHEIDSCHEKLLEMRDTVLQHQQQHSSLPSHASREPPVSEASLRELERVWEGKWNERDDEETENETKGTERGGERQQQQGEQRNPGFFHGDEDDTNVMVDDVSHQEHSRAKNTTTTDPTSMTSNSPVQMQLFYETTGDTHEEYEEEEDEQEQGDGESTMMKAQNLGF